MKQYLTKRKDFEAQALPQLEDLYRTALHVLDNESDAQDLVQESLVRAYHSWHKCQFSPDRRIWLFRIMVNALGDKYRPSPSPSVATNDAAALNEDVLHTRSIDRRSVEGCDQAPSSAISGSKVKKVIEELPVDIKLIVVLSLLEGFSYLEIADIAGIDLETVRSRLHQGRKLMQSELFNLWRACEAITA